MLKVIIFNHKTIFKHITTSDIHYIRILKIKDTEGSIHVQTQPNWNNNPAVPSLVSMIFHVKQNSLYA